MKGFVIYWSLGQVVTLFTSVNVSQGRVILDNINLTHVLATKTY